MSTTKRSVEIFGAGCGVCHSTITRLRDEIDPSHDLVVHDLSGDPDVLARAEAYGVRTVPAVVVDGALLACCRNTGPTAEELASAGVLRTTS